MLLHHAFEFHARSRGHNCFSRFEGCALSYRDANARSLGLAAAILESGVEAGDRIALLMRNSPDYLLLILAASRIGAVIVPLNYRLAPAEWLDLVKDAGARTIIADLDFAKQWDELLADRELDATCDSRYCLKGDADCWPVLPVADQAPHDVGAPPPASSDTLIQMYTSGTTGKAKGALLSHAAIVHNIAQSSSAFPYRLNPEERMLVVLPLFHIAALATVFGAISAGACLVIHRDVDPVAIAHALVEDEIVVSCLVPAVLQLLLSVPGIETMRFPALRYLAYGASPIAEPLLRKVLDIFRCDIAQGYGMTEAAGIATMLTEADHVRALADRPDLLLSAGKAVPGTEIRVVDAEGRTLPTGEVGEILLRGKHLMSGYWQMPEATHEALVDGWLHTGDAGMVDEEGYLFLRDRVKDMINSGAENIYPAEIERILCRHPSVAEVAVIGVPDERWGEAVMAVIVSLDAPPPPVEDFDKFCRKYLGGYKIPKHYSFVHVLPRNASGKVMKRSLREHYWKGNGRAIA